MTNDERLYDDLCQDAIKSLRHYSDHPWQAPLMSPEDVKKVTDDGREIFGPQSTEEDEYLCIDCGRSFGPNAEARDKHFMSPDCPQQGRYDREGTILNDE